MANEYEFEHFAHPLFEGIDRTQKVYFSTPEVINKQTGMLLLIAGFGGSPKSNVYKKMRNTFADTDNLIVVQTEYLGTEFMGEIIDCEFHYDYFEQFCKSSPLSHIKNFITQDGKVNLAEMLNADIPSLNIPLLTVTKETETNHVEFGPVQAIDCINALIKVKEILRKIGHDFDENKTLEYGHSHGAYLALLANRFFSYLLSMIVDGSAWLFPVYLSNYRVNNGRYKNHNITKYTKYWIFNLSYDCQIRDLRFLYRGFDNKANIIAYQGVDDELVNTNEKSSLFAEIPNTIFNLVTPDVIDGRLFKSTAHGDFDFLLLFEDVLNKYPNLIRNKDMTLNKDVQLIETESAKYHFFIENSRAHMALTRE